MELFRKAKRVEHTEEDLEEARARNPIASLSLSAIRYTDTLKLGLNPKNEYGTPTGLYFYENLNESHFASDRPYRWMVSISGPGVDLGNVDQGNLEYLIRSLTDHFGFKENAVYKAFDLAEEFFGEKNYRGLWWGTLRNITGSPNAWAGLMRKMGVRIVRDPGFSIIHGSEPAQIWISDISVIKDYKLISKKREGYVQESVRVEIAPKLTQWKEMLKIRGSLSIPYRESYIENELPNLTVQLTYTVSGELAGTSGVTCKVSELNAATVDGELILNTSDIQWIGRELRKHLKAPGYISTFPVLVLFKTPQDNTYKLSSILTTM